MILGQYILLANLQLHRIQQEPQEGFAIPVC